MKKFIRLIKEHKKGIIIVGCCVLAAGACGVVIYKCGFEQSLINSKSQSRKIGVAQKQSSSVEKPISNESMTQPMDDITSQKRTYTKFAG